MEAPTKAKFQHARFLSSKWMMHVTNQGDTDTIEIRDGNELIVTEVCKVLAPPPVVNEHVLYPIYRLIQVILPDGRSFTLQPDRSWLTEKGQRLEQLISDLEENDERTMASYNLVAW